NNLTGAPGVSSTVVTNTLAAKPTNIGQMYRWTPSSVLPIDLISFSGINFGKENHLDWTAGSQTNNDYFTLLRSSEGTIFSEVTRIDGAGTCSMPMSYSAIDEEPFPGTTYYQLKWTDFNGGFGTSAIIALTCNDTGQKAAIFPNPVNSILTVSYLKKDSHYSIVDLTGKMIREGDIAADNPWIDVSHITDGFYFLVINEKLYYKIFIQHG
ncbi:MAG TPA: T9SS type A sorting domain-containing protein, partial [Bacteroidia bacterium]|nr:T9SS type A sorting domain-containing protein [Bacteroidia bacterium]